jgi:hypothetical protein
MNNPAEVNFEFPPDRHATGSKTVVDNKNASITVGQGVMTQEATASVNHTVWENRETVLRNQTTIVSRLAASGVTKVAILPGLLLRRRYQGKQLREVALTELPIVRRRRPGGLGCHANAGETLRSCSDDEPRAS